MSIVGWQPVNSPDSWACDLHIFGSRIGLMGHRIDGEIQRQLAPIFRRNATPDIAAILHAERTTKSILAHHADQAVPKEQAFEMNICVAM